MVPEPPLHHFDTERADVFRPQARFEKTAVLLETPRSDSITVIRAGFGEQTMRGAFYLVASETGSYGAARAEFERMHVRVGPERWIKREPVRAYRATELCRVETRVGDHHEATVTARPGDWIVRQPGGEVMVLEADSFADRYVIGD